MRGCEEGQLLASPAMTRRGYFFVSAGGALVGVEAGGAGGSSRMPLRNSLTPWPRPRISSGILRPPNNTSTIIRMSSRCIGLSSIKISLPERRRLRTASYRRQTVWLQYNTLIASAPGQVNSIGVFEQRNGVFAGYAGEFLESGNRQALTASAFVFREQRTQILDGAAVKHKILRHFYQNVFTDKQLHQFSGAWQVYRSAL